MVETPVSYSPPVIVTSGATILQLRSLGFSGMAGLVMSQNGLGVITAADVAALMLVSSSSPIRRSIQAVDSYLNGFPTPLNQIVSQLSATAVALNVVLQALQDTAGLIGQNPGTLGVAPPGSKDYPSIPSRLF